MKRLILLSGLLLGLQSTALLAQAPPKLALPADPFVRTPGGAPPFKRDVPASAYFLLGVEVFAMSPAEAFTLLQQNNGAQRYHRTVELYQAGKARLVTVMAGSGRSAERGTVQSDDELRYPTEFDTAENVTTPAIGTAFETRNVGDAMEFTYTPGNEGNLELLLTRTLFRGFREIGWMPGDPTIPQPDFQAQRFEVTAQLAAGATTLLGTVNSPANEAGERRTPEEVWLVFGRISLRTPSRVHSAAPGGLIEYSIFSLDRGRAWELLKNGEPAERGFATLVQFVGEKSARLEHLINLPIAPGKRAVSSGVREFRYGTEWDPAGVVRKVLEATEKQTRISGENVSGQTPGVRISSTTTENYMKMAPQGEERRPGSATAFETTDLGLSIQQEVIGNDQAAAQEVHLVLQNRNYVGEVERPKSLSTTPPSPLFEARRTTGVIPIVQNMPMLVGTFNPPGETGVNGRKDSEQVWVVFVRSVPQQP